MEYNSRKLGAGGSSRADQIVLQERHGFDDESIRVMGIAFECARSALHIASSDDPLSTKLATKIIELASTGERDADKLCDFAIEGFRPPTSQ